MQAQCVHRPLEHPLFDALESLRTGFAGAVLERPGDAGLVQKFRGVVGIAAVVRIDGLEPVVVARIGVKPLALGLENHTAVDADLEDLLNEWIGQQGALLLLVGKFRGLDEHRQNVGNVIGLVGLIVRQQQRVLIEFGHRRRINSRKVHDRLKPLELAQLLGVRLGAGRPSPLINLLVLLDDLFELLGSRAVRRPGLLDPLVCLGEQTLVDPLTGLTERIDLCTLGSRPVLAGRPGAGSNRSAGLRRATVASKPTGQNQGQRA